MDSLILLNFIINDLLLLAAAKIGGCPFSRKRIALAAFCGALYAGAVWLPGMQRLLGSPLAKVLSGALIVVIAFGIKPWQRTVRQGIFFIAAGFGLAGAVLCLGMFTTLPTEGIPYLPVGFKTLFAVTGGAYLITTLVFRRIGRRTGNHTRSAEISFGGNTIKTAALVDTGHSLIDPVTGADVLILDPTLASQLFPPAAGLLLSVPRDPARLLVEMGTLGFRFNLVPYRTVEKEYGTMAVFRPDGLCVDGKPRKHCLVGVSPAKLDVGALLSVDN